MPHMCCEMQNKLSKTRVSLLGSMGLIISSRCQLQYQISATVAGLVELPTRYQTQGMETFLIFCFSIHYSNFPVLSNFTFLNLPPLTKQIPCAKRPLSKRPKNGFQSRPIIALCGQKYCRILQGEHPVILMAFIKLHLYHLSLRSLFCLFLSGRLTQVLLYASEYDNSIL